MTDTFGDILNYQISCGSLFGIPVEISVLAPLYVLSQCAKVQERGGSRDEIIWTCVVWGLLLFFTVLIHELGHSFAARSVGGKAHKIVLNCMGGVAHFNHERGPKGDLWVTFAGPLTHIPQAAIWYFIARTMQPNISFPFLHPVHRPRVFALSVAWAGVWIHLSLMIFNLLLPYPMDGGRMLVDLLLMAGVTSKNTAYISITLSTAAGVGMIAAGISKKWFFDRESAVLGALILYHAYNLYESIQKGQIEQHPVFLSRSQTKLDEKKKEEVRRCYTEVSHHSKDAEHARRLRQRYSAWQGTPRYARRVS